MTGGLPFGARSHITATKRQLGLPALKKRCPQEGFCFEFWGFFFFYFFLGGTGRIRQIEGDGKGRGGMGQDRRADGHSVGGGRCEGCRTKLKIQRKMTQNLHFPALPSSYCGKRSKQVCTLLVCFSLPLDQWRGLETVPAVTSGGRLCYWCPEGGDQGCCSPTQDAKGGPAPPTTNN